MKKVVKAIASHEQIHWAWVHVPTYLGAAAFIVVHFQLI